ncbi:MotE family protein [Rickettsiales endosymbiont of Stachyamoeba lipophora]|uniref:MotE family protein n=1 Tax=Rickettsiales endosymbiont of Stachyamoeba lipophora TaxID=2486578 RepID=UPI000F64E3E8|nr:hypothetical protein [Rickettsiales endosymbiont of Stachyamoeba lipophora]AZL15600.1 hypothetical protein EF513_03425 [Rickettsiales endosymbiont of Stachyamoeba lipophora]
MITFSAITLCLRVAEVAVDSKMSLSEFGLSISFAEASESETKQQENKQDEKPKTSVAHNEANQKCRNSIQLTGSELCTPGQIDLLKQLSSRREEIEKKAKELIDQENILKITEGKITNKLSEITAMRDEVLRLLKSLEQKENDKIDSLVKIYSNMKPKDAARIFEELDMDILIPVINKMKEAKSALIIAQMNPNKAKDLTISIASIKVKPDFCNCKLDK